MPVAHALRVGNRFGKGKHAHVTKLPPEIIVMIERRLLRKRLQMPLPHGSPSWSSRYCCFERSFRPMDHVDEREEGKRQSLLDRAVAKVRARNPHLNTLVDTTIEKSLKPCSMKLSLRSVTESASTCLHVNGSASKAGSRR